MVVGKDNVIKMKPGQQLHIVNQLYQYTVQFKEDPTGGHGGTKRPREPASEARDSRREESSMKAAKQAEKVSVSVSHGEATKSSVRDERKWVCTYLISTCFSSCLDFCRSDMSIVIMLQESVGHWSQGLKASMQDPKMQVAIVKKKKKGSTVGLMLNDLDHECMTLFLGVQG